MSWGWSLYARTLFARPGDPALAGFASCRNCRAEIPDWRARLLRIETAGFDVTEDGDLALVVERSGVCSRCGGGSIEIRVEGRRTNKCRV